MPVPGKIMLSGTGVFRHLAPESPLGGDPTRGKPHRIMAARKRGSPSMLMPDELTASQFTERIPSPLKVPATNSEMPGRQSCRGTWENSKMSAGRTEEVARRQYPLLRRKASGLGKRSYYLDLTGLIRLNLMAESLAIPVAGQAQRVLVSASQGEQFRAQTNRSGE